MLPTFIKPYFWDIECEKLDLSNDYVYVISRVAECGRIECIRWLFQNFSSNQIKEAMDSDFNISAKTKNLLNAIIA